MRVFPSKVTNIKSHNGCNNKTFHCARKPCLCYMFIVAHIYAILSVNKAEIDGPFG